MQESVIYQDWFQQGSQQGFQQGFQQGLTIVVLCQLKHCISDLNSEDETRITGLSVGQLEALGIALFDFSSRDDLLVWLDNN